MDTITDIFIAPFQYGLMRRALIVSVLVGIMCPALGAYVVAKGLGFMGDALAHAVLPGIVAAYMVGAIPTLAIFLGGLPVAVVVALTIGYLIRRVGVGEDTSIGILFVGLFALGLTMLTASRGLPINLEDLLLGQVLGVSQSDVILTSSLAAVILVLLFALHKELIFSSFDPSGSSVIGLPTEKLDSLLLVLLAVAVVLALQAVGIVLVISMLITPAATALLLVRNFVRAMLTGAAFGATSAVAGLYISFHFNLPSGPVIALVATSFFILAVAWKQRAAFLVHRRGRRDPQGT